MSDILKIEIGPARAGFFHVRASFRGSPVGVDVARPRNLLKQARTIAEAVATGAPVRRAENLTQLVASQPDLNGKHRSASTRILQEMGVDLFNLLVPGPVFEVYHQAVKAAQKSEPVRFCLDVHPDLPPLPWETLWDPHLKQPLALSGDLPFSRGLDTDLFIMPKDRPVKVLIMAASPKEYEDKPLDRVEWEAELTILRKIFAPLQREKLVSLSCVPSQSRQDLIKYAAAGYDVFHFIGHGDVDALGEGYILCTMDGGYGDKVDAGTLRNILWSERRRLSLVVLNACNSATAGRDVYGNTARTLAVNIPAVIGMQYPFSSRAAETFSESFYRAVAGRFSIQAALRQARLMLQATGPEWITPVLYLGGNDGVLVR